MLVLLASLLSQSLCRLPAVAVEDQNLTVSRVEGLTRDILLKEIELERFNLRYKQEVAKQGRWKGWRYFLSQEANASLTDAGLLVGMTERGGHMNNPKGLNSYVLQHGNVPGAVGQIIGAGGSALELAINQYHELRARRLGFSPGQARKHVLVLKADIDRLLAERDALVKIEQAAPLLSPHARVAVAEGQVLRDIRDLALIEYSQFHMGTRRFLAFQQSLYVLDIAKNTTGAIGNFVARHSLHVGNRHLNGPAGIMTIVSGALIVLTPVLSRLTGMAVGCMHKRALADCTEDVVAREVSKLEADAANMQRVFAAARNEDAGGRSLEAVESRMSVYDSHTDSFMKQLTLSTREVRAGNLAATENVLSGLFVGSTKIAAGVTLGYAGWRYFNSGRLTNSYIFSGATAYCAGTSWSMFDNLRIQVKREITNHRLGKQNLLPGQIIKSRLKQLDEMEAALKKINLPT